MRELSVTAKDGYRSDLELTADGRPRIAYVQQSGAGISLAACDANCEAASSVLRVSEFESAKALDAEYPVVRPAACNAGLWSVMSPSLALDPAGKVRLAYGAKYDARRLYQDPSRPADPPYYGFHEQWRNARMVMVQ